MDITDDKNEGDFMTEKEVRPQAVTRIRAEANALTPTIRPSISTFMAPSSVVDRTLPERPGWILDCCKNSRSPGVNSNSSGIRDTVKVAPALSRERGIESGMM